MFLVMGYSILLGESVALRVVETKEEAYKLIEAREEEQKLIPGNKHIWYYRVQNL